MEFEIDHEALARTFAAEAEDDLLTLEESLLVLEKDPFHSEALHEAFRHVHSLKGNAGIFNLEGLEELAHAFEDVLGALREGRISVDDDLVTLLLQSADHLRQVVAGGELSADHRASIEDLLAYAHASSPSPAVTPDAVPGEGAVARNGKGRRRSSLRVDLARLDQLLDLVGEIAVARGRESRLLEDLDGREGEELREAHRETDRLWLGLQELVMASRMVRLGPTLRRYHRTVRDLALSLDKEARLEVEGEDVEVDATVLEHLRDPLTHLIRNALDHGLERADERRRQGKEACGSLRLKACHETGSILIELTDDGAGFDRRKILDRARSAGLVAEGETPRDAEIDELVFEPGFTTADVASDVSGRGVGMDVVRRSIEAIRGSVRIESRKGQGTRVSIRLPLTLALIEGLEVHLAEETYVIPMDSVVESIDLAAEMRGKEAGVFHHRGRTLPFIDLRRFFKQPTTEGGSERRGNVVLVETGGSLAGLVVDDVIGQHQTVIKPLSRLFQGIPGLSGTTILSDGRVAFILDVAAILNAGVGVCSA